MSMMDLLTGGTGAPPDGAPAGADQPPSIPDPQPHLADPGPDGAAPETDSAKDHGTNEIETLKTMLGMAKDYMDIPTVEASEKHEMSKALSIVTKLLAGNQSMADQLTGGNAAMRKALGPSGAGA